MSIILFNHLMIKKQKKIKIYYCCPGLLCYFKKLKYGNIFEQKIKKIVIN